MSSPSSPRNLIGLGLVFMLMGGGATFLFHQKASAIDATLKANNKITAVIVDRRVEERKVRDRDSSSRKTKKSKTYYVYGRPADAPESAPRFESQVGNKFYASVSTGDKEEVLMPPEEGGRVLFVKDTESIAGRHIPVYLMGGLAAIGLMIAGMGVRKLFGGRGWTAG